MAVKGFEKQNAVKKKQQQKSRTSVQKISDADQAFILTMGEAFTKTDFCRLYHETFGITLAEAKTVFETLVKAKAIQDAPVRRHAKGPAVDCSADVVRLVGNRTGPFKFKSLTMGSPDKIVDKFRADNPYRGLLPDDVVFGRYNAYEMSFEPSLLVERPRRRVIFSVEGNGVLAVEGCGSVIDNKERFTKNKPVAKMRGKLLAAKLTEECCRPFTPVAPLTAVPDGVIGDTDSTQAEISAALERLGVPSVFSAEALGQAQELPDTVDGDKEVLSRVDLRDIGLMTIDGEDARDFDDAVWCTPVKDEAGGWRLLVAIADVSHYVTPECPLDKDAQMRCTSVYFPTRVVPMLPEKLSNGLCSLNPGVDRCALVCDMIVSAEGEVTAYQFYPALIRSKARLTYTSVWEALNGEPEDVLVRGGNLTDIRSLYALFKALFAARQKRGAADFSSAETEIAVDDKTQKILAIRKRDHNDAHRLIEECMLAANVCAADFVSAHKAKCLYRVHDAPALDRLNSLRQALAPFGLQLKGGDKPTPADYAETAQKAALLPAADVVNALLLRSMQRAVYSPVLKPHYGLNYAAYTHFTSPIRRYPDLLVHRTIRAILAGTRYAPVLTEAARSAMSVRMSELASALKNPDEKKAPAKAQKKDKEDQTWQELGLLTSAAERRADEVSRDIVAWMKADYLSHYRGKTFEGVITGANPAGVYVTLTGVFVDGFVHVSRLNPWEFFYYDEAAMCFEGSDTGQVFAIGDQVVVRVIGADTATRRIDFEMVSSASGKSRRKRRSKSRFRDC